MDDRSARTDDGRDSIKNGTERGEIGPIEIIFEVNLFGFERLENSAKVAQSLIFSDGCIEIEKEGNIQLSGLIESKLIERRNINLDGVFL